MTKLRIAEDLTLPVDAVTQTFLIVGKRGSGKSNTAARFVEQLYHAKLPFVVLDPVDTWYGLKAGRSGGPGLQVYVFGGRHQDLPLEAHDGALLAEVLCEHRISMVLSVKHLSGRERSGFMVQFAQTLFQKWTGGPLHVVLEEAHELAPQMAGGRSGNNADNEAAMLGAFKRLWKLGRASGIGGTAVTQRPASLSKDITTQSEILIAHRTIGPQDVKAIGEWVKYHGQHEEMLADLPSLPTGQAFVWAPEFPEGQSIGLRRTAVLLRDTYDSASTPKVGEQRIEPKELQPVDLERLRVKMNATIERAKAEDPKELRRQVAELKATVARLEKQPKPTADPIRQPERVEVPVLTHEQERRLESLEEVIARWDRGAAEQLRYAEQNLTAMKQTVTAFMDLVVAVRQATATKVLQAAPARNTQQSITSSRGGDRPERLTARREVQPRTQHSAPSTSDLTGPEQRILDAIAWLESIGVTEPEQTAVAFLAGYTYGGGAFNNPRGSLRTKGLVDYRGDRIVLTDAGRDCANTPDTQLDAEALQNRVIERLPGPERRLLEALLGAYPNELSNEELAKRAGYAPNAGAFNNPKGRLRTLGLVEYPRPGYVVAKPLLFLE